MYRPRHSDWSPRIELTPLIDVVFLLLTFFIYSLVMMIRADILPVRLTALSAGSTTPSGPGVVEAITIDKAGDFFWNRQPLNPAQLDQRLSDFGRQPSRPRLYLALEAQGNRDRGPLLIDFIGRIHAAGISDFVIVGEKPR